jgi:hypothetical protein
MTCRRCNTTCKLVGSLGRLTAQRCPVCDSLWLLHLDSAVAQGERSA